MKQSLYDFIVDWNKPHSRVVFSVQEIPNTGRPASIEVRYSAAKHQDFVSTDKWNTLKYIVDAKSHGTMHIVTNEYLFERGIIEIKIASSNHNYQEKIIIGVLRWIDEFFQQQ